MRGENGVREGTYRKLPSVRTLRSWRMNQTPISLFGLVSLNALTQRLPMRLRVNMPLGWERGSHEGALSCDGESKGPWTCCK